MKKQICCLGTALWLTVAAASRCLAEESLAERSATVVHNDVMKLFNIIAVIVECSGAVLMLWACFELGTGMQSREPREALKGYKMLGSSIVMLLASVIYTLLSA